MYRFDPSVPVALGSMALERFTRISFIYDVVLYDVVSAIWYTTRTCGRGMGIVLLSVIVCCVDAIILLLELVHAFYFQSKTFTLLVRCGVLERRPQVRADEMHSMHYSPPDAHPN